MDFNRFYYTEGEQPLDRLVDDGGFACIFRTIGIVGDSLSSGEFESRIEGANGYHDFYDYSWGKFMGRMIGSTVHTFCRGGMTAKYFLTDFASTCGIYRPENRCQAYIIALGVNDTARMETIGSAENAYLNRSPTDEDGIIHYYASIIRNLKTNQPDAKFFLVTIPNCNYDGCRLVEKRVLYNEELRKLAKTVKNTYVIDLERYAPEFDQKFHDTFYLGHMRPTGYVVFARMIASYIDYLIRRYPDDFAEVGFIGTPYHNVSEKW